MRGFYNKLNKKWSAIGLAVVLLLGCANGIPYLVTNKSSISDNTEMIFIGLPLILSMSGSSARLDENWMVTAAHNKFILEVQMKDVYYHPECDIAIYRDEVDTSKNNTVPVGVLMFQEQVKHLGYSVGVLLSEGIGTYEGIIKTVEHPNCHADILTTAKVMGGMSGGGVYNTKDELVGITSAFANEDFVINGKLIEQPTYAVLLEDVSDWLFQVTGVNYYKHE